jgi:hypothetical protein
MSESVQTMVFSNDLDADVAFARELLGLAVAPAGGGWLLFTLPPGQSGLDPTGEDDAHQLYLTCRDLDQAIAALATHGVATRDTGSGERGRAVSVALPGGGMIRLHEY